MDFLLVFTEWLDVGMSTIGLTLGIVLYRRRALLTDALWWSRTGERTRWMEWTLALLVRNRVANPLSRLGDLMKSMGHPLNAGDLLLARHILDTIEHRNGGNRNGKENAPGDDETKVP